jgi:hypothetical protein
MSNKPIEVLAACIDQYRGPFDQDLANGNGLVSIFQT